MNVPQHIAEQQNYQEKKNLCGYAALNNYDMCAQSNRFCSWMWCNGTIFGLDQKVEFKFFFKLCYQILVGVLTKVALNCVQFVWHGSKWAKCSKYSTKIVGQFKQI